MSLKKLKPTEVFLTELSSCTSTRSELKFFITKLKNLDCEITCRLAKNLLFTVAVPSFGNFSETTNKTVE